MEVQVSVAKICKFDSIESGDTLEIVERPHGGVSIVLADGQFSGPEAKIISSMVVRKVIALLAEGVRDGAAARASSDFLYTERNGKSSAYLNILSADFQTNTLVITRNNPSAVLIARNERIQEITDACLPIGQSRNISPTITEIPIESGLITVMFTDGLANSGRQSGRTFDICTLLKSLLEDQNPSAQEIADTLLSQAIVLDQGRPDDDISLVVLKVIPIDGDQIRRMSIRIPVPPHYLFQ